jgi:adenylate kinase family enzyme
MELISKKPIIYLIGGKSGSGKTTLGRFIEEELKRNGKQVASMMYSRYIKDYAMNYFGWDGKEEFKPRELLQKLGTEIIKEDLHKPRFLITRLCEDVEILSYFFDAIIVDDVREKEEIEIPKMLFEKVLTVKLLRKKSEHDLTEEEKQHPTEIDLDNYYNFDVIVENNGSLEELNEKAKDIANKVVY